MPENLDNRFGGNNPAEQREVQALQLLHELDEKINQVDINVLVSAICYMGQNTRKSLETAMAIAGRRQ